MSTLKSEPRWKDRLSDWSKYAAAAGAALAAATSAEADIVYTHPATPLKVALSKNPPSYKGDEFVQKSFSLFNGFHVQLNVANGSTFTNGLIRSARAGIYPGAREPLGGFVQFGGRSAPRGGGARSIANFPAGSPIALGPIARGWSTQGAAPPLSHGSFGTLRNHLSVRGRIFNSGFFVTGQPGFAGFRTGTIHGTSHDYGWMRLEVVDRNNTGFPNEVEIIDWAYNNVPNAPIYAGQGIPTGSPVPEPSYRPLALLGLGAAGLLAWRRRRAELKAGANRTAS